MGHINARKVIRRALLAAPVVMVVLPASRSQAAHRVSAPVSLLLPDGGAPSVTPQDCQVLCNGAGRENALLGCTLEGGDAGLVVSCEYDITPRFSGFTCGRRPQGFDDVACGESAAEVLGTMARLEAASVGAFIRLAGELKAHGAPQGLWARAERAARDERRHAAMVGALALRRGGERAEVRVEALPVRPLLDMALENAAEGCVRETAGAAVAAWQARNAGNGAVRKVFRSVAEDEADHAQLAWDVAEWAASRLGVDAPRQTMRDVGRALVDAALPAYADDVRSELGLPGPAEYGGVVHALHAALWA